MNIKIEKGIPLPAKYPFAQMEVGDSFAVPEGVSRNAINVAASRFGEARRIKFTIRMMPDKTLRCWRIE